jgi:penicillin-binding protein 1A
MKGIALVVSGVVGAALVGSLAYAGAQDCPSIDDLKSYRPPQATRVFAVDGSRLADLSHERRVIVELNEVPNAVANGFVAVEDRRFWNHRGVDIRGAGRAVWRNVSSASMREGFSTLTMQLTRNVYPEALPRSDRMRRKVCEVRLAGRIEDELGKREILRLYLNQIYMGDGLYGVEEAARAFFGKSVRGVTLAEAALIVGLAKNPEGYNPRRHPLRAIDRRNVVLDVLAREGVVTRDEATKAKSAPLRLAPPLEAAGPAPYVVAAVRRELRERYGSDADIMGLRVYTGIDPAIQRAAHEALLAQLRRIENGEFGRYRHDAAPSGRLDPAQGSGSPYLQGTVVVMDVHTGAIRALVGGRDFTHSSYDRALTARRQPGSAFKPIVYAAALNRGLTPSTIVETTPVMLADGGAPVWRPEDLVPDSVTSLSVRDALALSSNHAAVRIGEQAGIDNVVHMARALGLTTPIPSYPSIFLGSAEVIPAEFTAAYATLANGGRSVRPTLITRIDDARGNVLWQAEAAQRQVVDAGVAFLTTSMMEGVVDHGTGAAVRRAGFWLPAAGKTGTTNEAKDVWFAGATPDLAAAVWIGFDQPKQILANASGGRLAAPVWAEVMKTAYDGRPAPGSWQPPANVVTAAIDMDSGELATANCPQERIRIEYFLSGTEPRRYCPVHGQSGVERALRGLWQRITGRGGN